MRCDECDYHLIVNDVDPDDIETVNDVAILCQLVPNDYIIPHSKFEADRSGYMTIVRGVNKCDISKDSKPLSWCPLRENNINEN